LAKIRTSNEKCLKSMYKYGMKEVKMTPAEIDVFRKRLMPLWDEFAEKGYYSKAELAEVTDMVLSDCGVFNLTVYEFDRVKKIQSNGGVFSLTTNTSNSNNLMSSPLLQ